MMFKSARAFTIHFNSINRMQWYANTETSYSNDYIPTSIKSLLQVSESHLRTDSL